MELSQIIPHLEALIFASDKPLTNMDLTELLNNALGFIDDRASMEQIEAGVEGIREKYSAEFYAFELKQSGGGWQFLTKKEYHKTVAQLNGDKFLKRLSVAALETLAIIAYKQPITKSEIESIRGVNCDYAVQKLLEKDLVIIAGRNELAVGKPLIYATSKSFMDYFGINTTADLPTISEVLMEELIQATIVHPVAEPASEETSPTDGYEAVEEATTEEPTEEMPVTNAEIIAAENPSVELLIVETTGEEEIIEPTEPVTNVAANELAIETETEDAANESPISDVQNDTEVK
jgi:segregation and condensation protein B